MVDDDDLRPVGFGSHLAHIAIREKAAFTPGTLIAVRANLAANISGEREIERFKISIKGGIGIIGDIHQAHKLTVLGIVLHAVTLALHAVETEVVTDALHQSRVKSLDVLLHKRNVFIKELLLQGFVGCADNGDLAGAHNGYEVGETIMGWNHRFTSEIEMAWSINLNAPYRT